MAHLTSSQPQVPRPQASPQRVNLSLAPLSLTHSILPPALLLASPVPAIGVRISLHL